MSLEEKINQDYIHAMKARDSVRSSTINFLKAQIKQVRVDKRLEKVEDTDVIAVIKKQVKQRQESIKMYTDGNRQDLVQKETSELDILKTYLPAELGEEQLKKIVEDTIKETGAQSVKDMGKVIKAVAEKTAGQADNKAISEQVKLILSAK